ncbi:MAG: hypothetical protein IJ368_07325 [Oscillospiraceae bacterium]|nr:hypothetical protein [Oscillospiraceae bacterium]
MSDSISEGLTKQRAAFLLLAAACLMILTGCSLENEASAAEMPADDVLPSVTEYVSIAESFRMSGTSATENSSDSETVLAEDAASSQTEIETGVSAELFTQTSTEEVTEEVSLTEKATSVETQPVTTAELTSITEISSEAVTESTTVFSETAVVTEQQTAPVIPEPQYDAEFFSSDLFIGDSISTGYSLYGFLKDKNVFAKVGLNPSTVLTKVIPTSYGETDISGMLACSTPNRIYIMLGSNGIQWLSVSNMIQSTDLLVQLIGGICPDTQVVIVSVPPVTAEYDSSIEDVNVMAKINEYNASLSMYCKKNSLLFVDAAAVLKDANGYFDSAYAESDGMHFKSSAYKTLLAKIQEDVTAFAEQNAEQTETEAVTATEEAAVSEEETANPDETSVSSETEPAAETQEETSLNESKD